MKTKFDKEIEKLDKEIEKLAKRQGYPHRKLNYAEYTQVLKQAWAKVYPAKKAITAVLVCCLLFTSCAYKTVTMSNGCRYKVFMGHRDSHGRILQPRF